jgi:glycolate oxidase FAD binding subunit
VNDALARHGQWLPLDPPFAERATIGGILATNDSGPLRHRYGTPRDLVIGIQLATSDGVLVRAGGQVVKNVAGYDLAKLMAGSFGSLAATVSATFKLMPLPHASKTMVVSDLDADTLGQSVRLVMASQLEPLALELSVDLDPTEPRPRASLVLRFASLPDVVDEQIEQARALLGGSIRIHEGGDERALWQGHAQRPWNRSGAIVRASWLPADVAAAWADLVGSTTAPVEIVGRAGIGAGLIRIDADPATEARTIVRLRSSTSFGNVVLARGSADLKRLVNVWEPQGDRQPVFDALKRTLDPHGILNPGRGPI